LLNVSLPAASCSSALASPLFEPFRKELANGRTAVRILVFEICVDFGL
jgi:hypothetical protein